MSGYICLDSNISGWVFRDSEADISQDSIANYNKANSLIPKLSDSGFSLLIPTIVLSELASHYPESKQSIFYNNISKHGLYFWDFTSSTSRVLSRLLRKQYEDRNYSRQDITKAKMKYDIQILACAIDAGSECFYTEDSDYDIYKDLGQIAILGLDDLPPSVVKGTLFEE